MIYTIGHSNHPFERFLGLLQRHRIATLADVRSIPHSRFNPQFNRQAMAQALAQHGMDYLFLGAELGGRSQDSACHEDGRVSYPKLAATPLFRQGIERLRQEMELRSTAIMCAEKEPLDCHRSILIARELRRLDIPVLHILSSGELEPHEATLTRLRAQLKIPAADLFAAPQLSDEEIYACQARQMAYSAQRLRRRTAEPSRGDHHVARHERDREPRGKEPGRRS